MPGIRFILLLIVGLISCSALAQSPYWIQSAGSMANDEALNVAVDNAGNTYVTGYFSTSCNFGTITLNASGVTDIFLAKLDNTGQYEWAVKAGGTGPDRGLGVAIDSQGNPYITGYFTGPATFSGTSVTAVNGTQDVFIARYDPTGALTWVTTAGGSGTEQGNALVLDASDNVVLTGQFSGSATFGTTTLTSATDPLTTQPSIDVFTAKYDSGGNFVWAGQGSAPFTDRGLDVGTDAAGNVYITGQFSDTITFDNAHNNNMANAIFLVKYDASGVEQWFRMMGGAATNIAYGLVVDNANDIYVTGDHVGALTLFGSPNVTVSNSYPNAIFLAKYDDTGTVIWAESDGSDSPVSSRDVALDDTSNVYLSGQFECRFNEYADEYGQGVFNSIGYEDIFITKYNSAGTRQWMRHVGGQKEDFGWSLDLNHEGQVTMAGAFRQRIIFPGNANFQGWGIVDLSNDAPSQPAGYCGDPDYGTFFSRNGQGVNDIVVAKGIDPARQPLDYYTRSGSGCNRDFVGVCITDLLNEEDMCGVATVEACGGVQLAAASNTGNVQTDVGVVGPKFLYGWQGSANFRELNIVSSGQYWHTLTTEDGCFTSYDTVDVTLWPVPAGPLITDSKGVNIDANPTIDLDLCVPDTVQLCASAVADSTRWYNQNGLVPLDPNDSLCTTITTSGNYSVTTWNQFGCGSSTTIEVDYAAPLPLDSIIPKMGTGTTAGLPDSMSVCSNDLVSFWMYDSITNPIGDPNALFIMFSITNWTITSDSFAWGPNTSDYNILPMTPSVTGMHVFDLEIVLTTPDTCNTDTLFFYFTDSVFITVNSIDDLVITVDPDSPYLCPGGDTVVVYASGAPNAIWNGPGIISNPAADSVLIDEVGTYTINAIQTNNGCIATGSYSFDVEYRPIPEIIMDPVDGTICPNDSVMLTVNEEGGYEWYGPNGLLPTNDTVIYVDVPGQYYAVVTDLDSCILATSTAEVIQYTTPLVQAFPSTEICPGDSVDLIVVASDVTAVSWDLPLTGTEPIQTVGDSGIYTVSVTSCNIVTPVSINIGLSEVIIDILGPDTVWMAEGDSVALEAIAGLQSYLWQPNGETDSIIVVDEEGFFLLDGINADGCQGLSDPVIVQYAVLIPNVSDVELCQGDSTTISAISDGTIEWYDAETGGTLLWTGSAYPTGPVLEDDTLWVVAVNGPFVAGPVAVHISVIQTSYLPPIYANGVACIGDTLVLGTDTIPGATYSWTGPQGPLATTPGAVVNGVTVADAGTYTLTVSGFGCLSPPATIEVPVSPKPDTAMISTTAPVCEGDAFSLNGTAPAGTVIIWFGPSSQVDSGATIQIDPADLSHEGDWLAIADAQGCASDTVSVFVDVRLTPASVALVDAIACAGQIIALNAQTVSGGSYHWTGPNNLDTTGASIVIKPAASIHAGTYTLTTAIGPCEGDSTNATVKVVPSPTVNLGPDTAVCSFSIYPLNAGAGWESYLWQDGSEEQLFAATATGSYSVTVENEAGCELTESVYIQFDDCLAGIPNIFTPNGDGINDVWGLRDAVIENPVVRVYDRWGLLMHEFVPPLENWDGTNMRTNREVPEGVYYWVLTYTAGVGNGSLTGFIQLLR